MPGLASNCVHNQARLNRHSDSVRAAAKRVGGPHLRCCAKVCQARTSRRFWRCCSERQWLSAAATSCGEGTAAAFHRRAAAMHSLPTSVSSMWASSRCCSRARATPCCMAARPSFSHSLGSRAESSLTCSSEDSWEGGPTCEQQHTKVRMLVWWAVLPCKCAGLVYAYYRKRFTLGPCRPHFCRARPRQPALAPSPTLGRGGSWRPGLPLRARLCLLEPGPALPESHGWSATGGRGRAGERPCRREAFACKGGPRARASVRRATTSWLLQRRSEERPRRCAPLPALYLGARDTAAADRQQNHRRCTHRPGQIRQCSAAHEARSVPCGTRGWRAHGAAAPAAAPSPAALPAAWRQAPLLPPAV